MFSSDKAIVYVFMGRLFVSSQVSLSLRPSAWKGANSISRIFMEFRIGNFYN
jgi:hypothetical protein